MVVLLTTIKPLVGVGEALSRLNVVIRHYKALHPKNVIAYDDAVSDLGKICYFHCDSIELADEDYSYMVKLFSD